MFASVKYRIFKEKTTDEDGAVCFTYGIELIRGGKTERRIPDVSHSYKKIRKLCYLCNRHKLSSIHIDDVIEDFLCD